MYSTMNSSQKKWIVYLKTWEKLVNYVSICNYERRERERERESKVVMENSVAASSVSSNTTTRHHSILSVLLQIRHPSALSHTPSHQVFVAAPVGTRCLSSLRVDLSAVRYFLPYTCASVSCLCSERLTSMLRGVERTSGGRTSTRIGLTSADLGTMHNYIVISNFSVVDCTMLWAAVSVGFHGLLRSSEI